MKNKNRNYWPLASLCSVMIFTNVTIFTILNTKLGFPLYAAVVIFFTFFWPVVIFMLSELEYIKKIKEVWSQFPDLIHKGISLFCLLWSLYFIFGVVIPFLKKNYAKNK